MGTEEASRAGAVKARRGCLDIGAVTMVLARLETVACRAADAAVIADGRRIGASRWEERLLRQRSCKKITIR